MEIGEKIKRLRTAKLMTQAELAGNDITRNMLSRIENGAAQPSIGTVRYIANRLNVSPGFLLAGEDDEQLYFKAQEIGNIKKMYAHKNFRLCKEMCENSEWSDDELMLIGAECCLRVGVEDFCAGNLRSALEVLDKALEYSSKTIYNTIAILAEARAYFDYMSLISPTLISNIYDEAEDESFLLLGDRFCVYSDMFRKSESVSIKELPCFDERMELLGEDSSYAIHLNARALMDENRHHEANQMLHKLLFDGSLDLPEPMLYFVFCDLEICCKETGDFKGAYEYSGNKIALLQKLIS